ncbi:MAG: Bax inhibitor-1/YccA family protein [Caldilineales bacterium]|nr:Bax inhibitor-1/YccA family protein [Caldilineales bacterium]MDW8316375.1 Bax inhibitor-1/YccA family protein [Anaerolineae bacterium]
MAASSIALERQDTSNNPALNQEAFNRATARGGETAARMTARGAYLKTGLLLVLTILAAAWGWSQVEVVSAFGRQVAYPPSWLFLAFVLSFVFGVLGVFAGRFIPIFAIGYALSYGALLGVASHYYNLEWNGIVLQAIVATLAVFGGTWLLYSLGILKVTSVFAKAVAIAMAGLLLLYFTAWIFSLFGVNFRFLSEPTPLGILFALFVVILAALNLPLDFEFVRRASAAGAPKYMEWYAAHGLMLSMIWLYVSILRLLALLRSQSR